MKAYITKYALTKGILEVEAHNYEGEDYIYWYSNVGGFPIFCHGKGKDWHRTLDAAKDRADKMRQARIASLKRSIKKLEALTFT